MERHEEWSLRRAIDGGEFELHYQPQLHIASGRVVGMEALIRWRHPAYGLLLPGVFIPAAEQSGLIVSIAEWVLRTGCRQNKEWHERGLGALKLSINLSALQFRQAGFIDLIRSVLDETRLAPCFLDLECSESLVAEAVDATLARFHLLRTLGVGVSIDDFGTGYAEIGHFMNFPLHQLKIDRRFVHELPHSTHAASVARSIVNMGHSFGARVTAIGVETAAQLSFLRSIWCQYAQGNYYSKPLPAHFFEGWVRQQNAQAGAADDPDLLLAA